jgi:UDP:flavonoid glycosyltransferase YjiC (YdhE family)
MAPPHTRVLLVPYGLAGHVGPVAVLGEALQALGHKITVLVAPDLASGFTRLGLATWSPRRWRADAPVPREVMAAGDPGAIFRHLLLGSVVDMTLDVEEALRETGADVLVGDVFMPGAGLAAQRANVPWASLACSPVPAADSYTVFIDPLMLPYCDASSTLAELGLPVRPQSLFGRISPDLHLIPVTPRFAGDEAVAALPGQVRLVGPLVPAGRPIAGGEQTDRRTKARPSIVVATSSNAWQRVGDGARRQQRALRIASRALACMDVAAVLIVPPGASAESLGPASPNVRRTGLLPADEFDALIEDCAAVVSHGGWGTVARALIRGLPLVVVPTSIDQPYTAQRCHELGVGIAVDPLTATPAQLRAAIEAVCGDASYRTAAQDFAAELRAAAPAETAAALVAGLAARPAAGIVTDNLSTAKG